jgi:hypothetical protein
MPSASGVRSRRYEGTKEARGRASKPATVGWLLQVSALGISAAALVLTTRRANVLIHEEFEDGMGTGGNGRRDLCVLQWFWFELSH